jgi:tRNA(Ile)-lysidine synthase
MLRDRVARTIKENNLIKPNQHIVIGLSGGPDSVCLFHVLMSLKDSLNLTLYPVHINHQMREGAADRDQQYVEELCRSNGIHCTSHIIDCNQLASDLRLTSEEAGRKARYDAFYQKATEVASGISASTGMSMEDATKMVKIAVAHNANDQAETILFRILRGTGTDGLAGIPYSRDERGFTVIRPILDITREEIEAYCREHGLNPVIDHTNSESLYTRNKIRNDLIPQLEKTYNENLRDTLLRLGRIAAADKDYIWQETERLYKELVLLENYEVDASLAEHCVTMDRAKLADIHIAIRHRMMIKAFGEVGLDQNMSEERLAAADSIIEKKQGPKKVEFPQGHYIEVASGKVKFV